MRCPALKELPPPPAGKTGWPWTEESTPAPDVPASGEAWPRISIVTPSYNQSAFLEETIRSVLLQGYPKLEYFVVDGGSTDGSIEIIEKYSRWLTQWVSERDSGQTEAINKGFAWSGGDILGYLNSDDVYFPSALVSSLEHARKRDYLSRCILSAPVQDIGDIETLLWHSNSDFGGLEQWLDGGVSLHQPGILWTKALWGECGPFRENLDFTFDRFFFATCFIKRARFFWSDKTRAGFRVHSQSKTSRFFFSGDGFVREWEEAKTLLESILTPSQKANLVFRRHLTENWKLVGRALASEVGNSSDWHPLLAKVARQPWWFFHRPVGSALIRLSRSWIRSHRIGFRDGGTV